MSIPVLHAHDVNTMPMKTRNNNDFITAHQNLHQQLTQKGCKPKLQQLNNEASAIDKGI